MENGASIRELEEQLAMKAQSSFHIITTSSALKKDSRDHLQKMHSDFASSHWALAKVMEDDIGTLEKVF